jgi:hypothetical protein
MDALCDNCQDLADARVADLAHELVDEGNLQYKYQWVYSIKQPSGHDWVSATQIVGKDTDGFFILRKEYFEGEIHARAEIPNNLVVCNWCHLTTLAQVKCVNCDEYVS